MVYSRGARLVEPNVERKAGDERAMKRGWTEKGLFEQALVGRVGPRRPEPLIQLFLPHTVQPDAQISNVLRRTVTTNHGGRLGPPLPLLTPLVGLLGRPRGRNNTSGGGALRCTCQ
jgi:hypothetical protein